MNPNTHKLCKKCKSEYPHYNSGFTKCNNCPGKIIKQEKKENGSIEKHISKGLSGKYGSSFQKIKIRSERKGKNLYRLTSEPRGEVSKIQSKKETYRIPKISAKQASINAALTKIKAQLVNDNDSQCFTCPKQGDMDLSHLIPRSKRKDLVTEKRNLILQCRSCHEGFEGLNVFKIRKFKNLNYILETIQSLDQSRYIHITERLNNQLTASR